MSNRKEKITIYLEPQEFQNLRELEFCLRRKRSHLVAEILADAYRRWKEEQARSNEKKESQPQSEENPYA